MTTTPKDDLPEDRILPDVIIRIKRTEEYDDVHPEILVQDFLTTHTAWEYSIEESTPAIADGVGVDKFNEGLTLAHNIITQEIDRINADDGSMEAMNAMSECQRRIRGCLESTPPQAATDEVIKRGPYNCNHCGGDIKRKVLSEYEEAGIRAVLRGNDG